jgi:hypothetical protein
LLIAPPFNIGVTLATFGDTALVGLALPRLASIFIARSFVRLAVLFSPLPVSAIGVAQPLLVLGPFAAQFSNALGRLAHEVACPLLTS